LMLFLLIAAGQFSSVWTATCNIAGGTADDTNAIISAFNTCGNGGKIVFTKGVKYNFARPDQVLPQLSNATVQLDGTIALPASTAYSTVSPYLTIKGKNVVVQGTGVIDGNGQVYWNAGLLGGPHLIKFTLSGTSSVNTITISNSPAQHVSVDTCSGTIFNTVKIVIDRSRLQSGKQAKNTDGYDISNSADVQILNSYVDNNDDCIAVNGGTTGVKNLLIDNIECHNGHGISIGSLGKSNKNDIVDGVKVQNSRVYNNNYVARIKSFLVPDTNTGYARNIYYKNVVASGSNHSAICLTQNYCDGSDCGSGTSAFVIEDITYESFDFESVHYQPLINLACHTKSACGPFTFSTSIPSGSVVACTNTGTITGLTCTTSSVVSCN